MYKDEDNSTDLIGAFCELLFPKKGHRNGIIVDDYGNEWLVQLTNGREVLFIRTRFSSFRVRRVHFPLLEFGLSFFFTEIPLIDRKCRALEYKFGNKSHLLPNL
ncbi:hypothetical protein [Prevotella heparinolytica]|uniref:hypothetical protein n=1 Tax=Prevotella heparinolytica TaxID=28113 RepID=UPI001F1F036B|nr:hypothetical protein [Bacteroides heparinolyticus]